MSKGIIELPAKVWPNKYVYEILPGLILTSHAKARLSVVLDDVSLIFKTQLTLLL